MKNLNRITLLVTLCILIMVSDAFAGGTRRKHTPDADGKHSIGIRLGWSGGVNGATYRYSFNRFNALEVVAGYSPKEGRIIETEFYNKGNFLMGVRYQPQFLMHTRVLGVGFYGSVGATMRIHNWRPVNNDSRYGPKVTPDALVGGGMLIEIAERVELFGDIHFKYYNNHLNNWVISYETGAGIRVKI